MKKRLFLIIVCGLYFSACACLNTYNDSNVSIYTCRTPDETYYFYLSRENNFYVFDCGEDCEVGLCRFKQDTLYCYPRSYKDKKRTPFSFSPDSVSWYYTKKIDSIGNWENIYETKYLIRNDRLYSLSATEDGVIAPAFLFEGDPYLQKIELKDLPKYRKKIVFGPAQ